MSANSTNNIVSAIRSVRLLRLSVTFSLVMINLNDPGKRPNLISNTFIDVRL